MQRSMHQYRACGLTVVLLGRSEHPTYQYDVRQRVFTSPSTLFGVFQSIQEECLNIQ